MEVRIIQVHQEHIIYLEVRIILRNILHGTDAGTKVCVQYNSSKKGTIALNILGDVVNNPEKSGRFDFIRADRNTDVTINMNGHTFTYSGNDVYSLCGFVENSGTMTINGSGGTIVSDKVGLNSKEGVLNVNDATIKANRIGIYNKGRHGYLNLKM